MEILPNYDDYLAHKYYADQMHLKSCFGAILSALILKQPDDPKEFILSCLQHIRSNIGIYKIHTSYFCWEKHPSLHKPLQVLYQDKYWAYGKISNCMSLNKQILEKSEVMPREIDMDMIWNESEEIANSLSE
ncbi:hypothetical protein Ciccas_008852 [Cichlidogyrus casuarinus]|uniref:Uncharacterized protein n=1 Tax=Cichlidogyrus casuarinus TaxID=1844966 RepID=A0ABD2Q0D4_9PLAT